MLTDAHGIPLRVSLSAFAILARLAGEVRRDRQPRVGQRARRRAATTTGIVIGLDRDRGIQLVTRALPGAAALDCQDQRIRPRWMTLTRICWSLISYSTR
ncbi:hypothetical protein [Streptomyces marianii]|uniref:hypothetical protein n=1 Tax=Streptomyces marianii TaxID=1817406 RepID=UPI001486C3D0|nr:hypothetical protein [Streptomyces marianii]